MGLRRAAYGVKLSWAFGDWAYAPGEFKLPVSPDGANFGEAVTVVARLPRAWGYFSLRSLSLIAGPGAGRAEG